MLKTFLIKFLKIFLMTLIFEDSEQISWKFKLNFEKNGSFRKISGNYAEFCADYSHKCGCDLCNCFIQLLSCRASVLFNFCRATKSDEVEWQKLDGWIQWGRGFIFCNLLSVFAFLPNKNVIKLGSLLHQVLCNKACYHQMTNSFSGAGGLRRVGEFFAIFPYLLRLKPYQNNIFSRKQNPMPIEGLKFRVWISKFFIFLFK